MSTVREILARVARRELTAADAAVLLRALPAAPAAAAVSSDPAGSKSGAVGSRPLLDDLRRMLASALKLAPEQIDFDRPLSEYGLTSITVTALLQAINTEFATKLAPTVIFEFSTLRAFAGHLERLGVRAGSGQATPASAGGMPPVATPARPDAHGQRETSIGAAVIRGVPTPSSPATERGVAGDIESELARLWAEAERIVAPAGRPLGAASGPLPQAARDISPVGAAATMPTSGTAPGEVAVAPARISGRRGGAEVPTKIAIVGMAGVMPQCDDLGEFWQALRTGRNLISEAPRERWDWTRFADAPAPGARWGGFVRDPAQFDAGFFGVSPLEARLMDPQQRIFLQAVWHALEDAGYRPADLAGSATGVFVGVSTSDYFEAMREAGAEIDAHTSTGFAHCLLANRVSFLFDWRGPSQVVDTACSSSLIALHRAAQAIAAGDCTAAIVGGVNLLLTPTMFLSFAKAGMLSPDGRCQTFDRRANGYVRGEGVGALLLKPLAQAEADGDVIHGVILSTAENHGGRATSLTAPNPAVQAELLVSAYRRGGVDPRTIGYIETHGTGTALGDPIEFSGLQRAFGELTRAVSPTTDAATRCWLGSVKTNIGHLESAAGIAGLLKVLLALRHGSIPPNLHFRAANPHLEFAGTAFGVPTQLEPWRRVRLRDGTEAPRRAGVSSFGFGGAYAHVVLEEYAAAGPGPDARGDAADYVLISAPTPAQLDRLLARWTERLSEWREGSGEPCLRDVAATSRAGRVAHACRVAFRVTSLADLREALVAARQGVVDGRIIRGETSADRLPASGFIAEHDALPEVGPREHLVRRWCAGDAVAWSWQSARRVPLPLFPFAETRFWFEAAPRSFVAAGAPVPSMLAYESRWEPAALPSFSPGSVAVFGTPETLAPFRPVVRAMTAQGARIRFVACAEAYRDANGSGLEIDARSPEGIGRALQQLRREGCTQLLLVSDSVRPVLAAQPTRGSIFKEKADGALLLAFRFLQAASRENSAASPFRVAYAFHDALGVDAAREAALGALALSAYQEPGDLVAHAIGFAGSALDAAAVLAAAVGEVAVAADEPREVRCQDGERWVRRLVERAPDAGPGLPFTRGATYLVAGGLGEVGTRFAAWLARTHAANVVVLGRRTPGAETAARLAAADAGAGRITYRSTDLTDEDGLRQTIQAIAAEHGALRGVFHLAREVAVGLLAGKDETTFARVTAAKVAGTVALDAATADQPLDFFVLFSSIAGDWGLGGAADYAYACRFQNTFAAVRRSWVAAGHRRGQTLAIGWPQWRYDAHSHADRDRFLEDRGFTLLDDAAGFAWLAQTADARRTHTAFVGGDVDRLRTLLTPAGRKIALDPAAPAREIARAADASVTETDADRAVRELLAEMSDADLDALFAAECPDAAPAAAPSGSAPAPTSGSCRTPEIRPLEGRPVAATPPTTEELRATVRALLGAVLQHAPASIAGTTPFERLGMDSILGVRVVQRLENALGITVPPRWLIENATVDTLAQKIRSAWPPGQAASSR